MQNQVDERQVVGGSDAQDYQHEEVDGTCMMGARLE